MSKMIGKIALLVVVVGLAIGVIRWYTDSDSWLDAIKKKAQETPLGRPLRVGIVSWPGYAGGIVANNGFKPNTESIFWNNNLIVEFVLVEDADLRAKAFARGGPLGLDIVWSTVDFWANELPGFKKEGINARAIMQVDWSRGGDAIVADGGITKVEDLRGKKISLAALTPSEWLLTYSLDRSSLSEPDKDQIFKNLYKKNASPDARADFIAGKVDATVVWEPDVTAALKRPGSHILLSTKTSGKLIADVVVAREEFIKQYPDVIRAFIKGWLDGTEQANRKPDQVVKLLMENEDLYNDLGEAATRAGLSTVRWATLLDNARMFGFNGSKPLFDTLFGDASDAWLKRGIIGTVVDPADARDVRILKEIFDKNNIDGHLSNILKKNDDDAPAKTQEDLESRPPTSTERFNVYFVTGSATLDRGHQEVLDDIAKTALINSSANFRVEGNTDDVGDPVRNKMLSLARANSVIEYLVRVRGFRRERFFAAGNGDTKPVANNGDQEGRKQNRRTDILLLKEE